MDTETQPLVTALRGGCPRCGSGTLFAGIVTFAHRLHNQDGELVCVCERTALLQRRP